jgi:ParB family transcriptional regulator, chromosome partitioning protein
LTDNTAIEQDAALHFPIRAVESMDGGEAAHDISPPYEGPADTGLESHEPSLHPQAGETPSSDVRLIPITSIHVVNPRERNKKKFQQIVANISRIGLKKPITVRQRSDGRFDLVCGQGRLEAFRQLGETMVPAIIRDVSTEDALLMGLVENIARKKPSTMDTVRQLVALRERGYTQAQIGQKTGIVRPNVAKMLCLYDHGEEHLLNAVDAGRVSLSSAMIISRSDSGAVQAALAQALEEKKITPSELKRARALADTRRAFGKDHRRGQTGKMNVTPESIVRTFRREQERQRQALKKAELCEAKLVFTTSAMRMLFRDENFANLLRAEGLETVPEYVAEQIRKGDNHG